MESSAANTVIKLINVYLTHKSSTVQVKIYRTVGDSNSAVTMAKFVIRRKA